MIPLIDMTPESCRRRLGRRRQIQLWATGYAATIIVVAVASAILSLTQDRSQRRLDYRLQQVQLNADQQRQALDLLARIDTYESQIKRSARLAWPFSIGDMIATIGEATPKTVTITSFSFKPRARAGRSSGWAPKAGQVDFAVIYVELAGVAPDDIDVAKFVTTLQDLGFFSAIVMDYARASKFGDGKAREFGLTCAIDLAARFVRPGEGSP